MAINLSALAGNVTKAVSLSNLVLVTPQEVVGYQPQRTKKEIDEKKEAPPRFLFDYQGEQKLQLKSLITNYVAEDNTSYQDHIALDPEVFTTNGFIGELNNVPPPGLDIFKSVADRLTNIEAFAPQLSRTASNAYNAAFAAYQVASNIKNTAVSAWSSLNNFLPDSLRNKDKVQNKQQVALQQFYGYWAEKRLFTVQTPWAVIEDMAILDIQAVQESDTETISTFIISFQRMRFAATTLGGFGATALDGRAASQASGLTDLGISSPTPSISLSQGLGSVIG